MGSSSIETALLLTRESHRTQCTRHVLPALPMLCPFYRETRAVSVTPKFASVRVSGREICEWLPMAARCLAPGKKSKFIEYGGQDNASAGRPPATP